MDEIMTIAEASAWASQKFQKEITKSNISYLITYGRIRSLIQNGRIRVYKQELMDYFNKEIESQRNAMLRLQHDVNQTLAFENVKEKDRTKHVHRLHPYKGKFIPQLVEYFLDQHVDRFKNEIFFNPGDIVLDPFCGSGTTLVQASELGLHAIGFDVSEFNTLISNTKVQRHNLPMLIRHLNSITYQLMSYHEENGFRDFDSELSMKLMRFNAEFFPSPEYKLRVRNREIDHKRYGEEKSRLFKSQYDDLVRKHSISLLTDNSSFLRKWYLPCIRAEIEFIASQINMIDNIEIQNTLWVILSRTMRSVRATAHQDLATLKEPMVSTYYCRKHMKICKPLFTLTDWWKRYSDDAVRRIVQFDKLRTETYQVALSGDSRTIPMHKLLAIRQSKLASLVKENGISGIFSSPPYVGMIDYHEQHAYAYEVIGISRKDDAEIGPLFLGKGKAARDSYVTGIADVLKHCKKFLRKDYNVFLVANDKFNLYGEIADLAHMKIVKRFERPVLRRSEFDQSAYSETIFHLKGK